MLAIVLGAFIHADPNEGNAEVSNERQDEPALYTSTNLH